LVVSSRQESNDDGEACAARYADVAYGCACPGARLRPMGECGGLCRDARTCGPLCTDGSPVPGGSGGRLVRLDTCESWEYAARYEVNPHICPHYAMTGAMCGCAGNPPREDGWSTVCGDFCGPSLGDVPDPDRVVLGKTCGEWHYDALYLPWRPEARGRDGGDALVGFGTCDSLGMIAHGCGCGRGALPPSSCGPLCPDGGPLPDPSKVVGGRTCSDWEVLSSFDERLDCERQYSGIIELCGCATGEEYDMPGGCFEPGQLDGRTFFFFGKSTTFSYLSTKFRYSISFGPDGRFTKQTLWNADDMRDIVVGYSRGTTAAEAVSFSTTAAGKVRGEVVFSGGFPCIHRPSTGLVRLVETDGAAKPEIVRLNEPQPEACRYVAVMSVPRFCEGVGGDGDGLAQR